MIATSATGWIGIIAALAIVAAVIWAGRGSAG